MASDWGGAWRLLPFLFLLPWPRLPGFPGSSAPQGTAPQRGCQEGDWKCVWAGGSCWRPVGGGAGWPAELTARNAGPRAVVEILVLGTVVAAWRGGVQKVMGTPPLPGPGPSALSTPSPRPCPKPGRRGSLLGPYLRCWCLGRSVGTRGRGMAGSATCSRPPGRTGTRRLPERACCRSRSRQLGEGAPVRPSVRGSWGPNPHLCQPQSVWSYGQGRGALTAEVRGPPVHTHAFVQAGLGIRGHRVTQALTVAAGVTATRVSHTGFVVGQMVHL